MVLIFNKFNVFYLYFMFDILYLGLLKREAEREGSKLKIIISSATLEQQKFSDYFDGAPVFHIPGNMHRPEIIHKPEVQGPVENYIAEAVRIIKGINLKTSFPKGPLNGINQLFSFKLFH